MAQAIGFGLFLALMLTVALRLLVRAQKGGDRPMRWIGLYFFCIAGMFGCRAVVSMPGLEGSLSQGIFHFGNALYVTSDIVLLRFTWGVFRPKSAWAHGIMWVGSTLLVGIGIARVVLGEDPAVLLLLSVTRSIPPVWAFCESTIYWRRMRLRARLGIAEPIVANRFLLWSIWIGAMSLLPIFILVMRVILWFQGVAEDPYANIGGELGGEIPLALQVSLAVICSTGMLAIASLWLCFFPPRGYIDWVNRGATAEQG